MVRTTSGTIGEARMKSDRKRYRPRGTWLLQRLLSEDVFEEKAGDMEEVYSEILEAQSRAAADRWYRFQWVWVMIVLVWNGLVWRGLMIKSYCVMTYRNIKKHRLFSFINVFGLALGMSVCMFIIKLIVFLSSFDTFHSNHDRIYMVNTIRNTPSGYHAVNGEVPPPLARHLRDSCPAVEKTLIIARSWEDVASSEGRAFRIECYYTDHHFFNLFDFKLLSGDTEQILEEPNTVVITKSLALKWFETEDAEGEILHFPTLGNCLIVGVMEDFPYNSHFRDMEVLISYSTLQSGNGELETIDSDNWQDLNTHYLFFLFDEHAMPEQVISFLNTYSNFSGKDPTYTYSFQIVPLKRLTYSAALQDSAFGTYFPHIVIIVLSIAAVSILVTACFNYTNLTLAESLSRLKEIGIRKVVGASRFQLFSQFIGESILLSVIALIVAFGLQSWIVRLFFGLHPDLMLFFRLEDSSTVLFLFFGFALVTGVLAGLFPASLLSRLRPIEVISRLREVRLFSGLTLRKLLIVIQFSLALIFIMLTITNGAQIRFARTYELGFETDQIVHVATEPDQVIRFREECMKSALVSSVSASEYVPGTATEFSCWTKKTGDPDSVRISTLSVDPYFIRTLGLTLIAGHYFPANIDTEVEQYTILNEMAVGRFGWNPAEAIGKMVSFERNPPVEIIGVVKDFTIYAYHESINPLALRYLPHRFQWTNIRFRAGTRDEQRTFLETTFRDQYPEYPFRYIFYKDAVQKTYLMFTMIAKMAGFISILAVCISCLGLLAMAMFHAETHIKEVGIRKVLGASGISLVHLLSKGFLRLLVWSIAVAVPLSWFIHFIALSSLDNHAELGVVDIFLGIGLLFIVGFVTVLTQTIRAARSNPVENLKYE